MAGYISLQDFLGNTIHKNTLAEKKDLFGEGIFV